TPIMLTTETQYPSNERITIAIEPAESKSFSIKLRVPAWCRSAALEVNGHKLPVHPNFHGYVAVHRTWEKGDRLALRLKLEPRLIIGDHINKGKVPFLYGPLVQFADAGSAGTRYKDWLPLPLELYRGNLLLDGKASNSRQNSIGGSMTDEDFETFVTTSDGNLAAEDWFAVQLNEPILVKRVLFAHGKTLPNGAWFDASSAKSHVQ